MKIIKIVGINLLVFALYAMLITSGSNAADRGFSIAIGLGICTVIHFVLVGIAGLVLLIMGKRDWAWALLISAGVLVPVGFCTWLILLSIYG